MAPIMRELESRNVPYHLVFTGQHNETMDELLNQFEISTKPQRLREGADVTGIGQMAIWFARTLGTLVSRRSEFVGNGKSVFVVHGDTFSTLLGAVAGRMFGAKVAHVESGLRSFNIFHPFPEELTRLAVFRLADIAYCPNSWAEENLSKYRLEKVNCGQNTLLDAVRFAMAQPPHEQAACDQDRYGVVSIHRFENIFKRNQFSKILDLLEIMALTYPLVFVLHPATRKKLEQFNLMGRVSNNPQFVLRNRMGYIPFLQLLTKSSFVVTDGGSNQEELSYLGIPTLLMRRATERTEGLESNVVISNYEERKVRAFLEHLQRTPPKNLVTEPSTPSRTIVEHLIGASAF
jgi:UDP-N-acetylglucosamine 2-epimerase (non-hydrolysing)